MSLNSLIDRLLDRLLPSTLPDQTGLTVVVSSSAHLEKLAPAASYVCIDIHTPGTISAALAYGWAAELPILIDGLDAEAPLRFPMMTADIARTMLEFARRHAGSPIVVHDEHGGGLALSVALFLSAWLGRPYELAQPAQEPNLFVLKMLRFASGSCSVHWRDRRLVKAAVALAPENLPAMLPNASLTQTKEHEHE